MYTFPLDKSAPGARLRLTPAMLDHDLNVQPFDITIDVPLMFDRLPDEVRQIILQALAADASVEEKDIQQDTIAVYAGLSCDIRHSARKSPDSRSLMCPLVPDCDNISLVAYAMTTPDAEGQEHPVSAILDTIGAYFAKGSNGTISEDAQAYIDHIIDDVCLLAFANDSTTFDLNK